MQLLLVAPACAKSLKRPRTRYKAVACTIAVGEMSDTVLK
jgi:hypothetical protein